MLGKYIFKVIGFSFVVIKCVIFDFDQTLVDTLGRFYKVYNSTLKLFGLNEISWKDFIKSYAEDTLDEYVPAELREKFWRIFLEKYGDFLGEIKPIEGSEYCLKYLKAVGLTVVVTTGRRAPNSELIFELVRAGFIHYVDYVFTAEGIMFKNHVFNKVCLLKKVLNELMLNVDDVLFVADYRADVLAARKLGVAIVAVETGLEDPRLLKELGALAVLPSVKELPPLLEASKLI